MLLSSLAELAPLSIARKALGWRPAAWLSPPIIFVDKK